MNCNNCGANLQDGAKFCVVCGQPVIQQNNMAAQQVQQPMQQNYPQQPMQQGYPQQQPMQQGYPQQQPMQQGYPQQQPIQQGYTQQQPMQQGYPQQQPMQQGYPQQQPMQQSYPQQQPMYQGFQQQANQQQTQQVQFIPPTYPEGTPVLTIVWKGTAGSIDGMQNAINKKVAKSTKYGAKQAQLQILVNGQAIAPEGVINYYNPIKIDVPITGGHISLEIKTKSWVCKSIPFEFDVNPTESYTVELTEPCILAWTYLFGLDITDSQGNLVYSLGNTPALYQILAVFIPLFGFIMAFTSNAAKESEAVKKLYIYIGVLNTVLLILTLLEIFS